MKTNKAPKLSAEDRARLEQQKELQSRYNAECRKLNAARSLSDASKSIEAIRLCGDNIKAIKQEASENKLVLDVAHDDSFGTDEPHVHISREGEAIFVCGDVRFRVDIKDLNKVVGCNGEDHPLNKLMDSQLIEMARSIGLQTEPFSRELVMIPLTGLMQLCWYRDLEKHTSDHLKSNQTARVEAYHRQLSRYTPGQANANGERRALGTKRESTKVSIPAEHHKKMLAMHKEGKSTGTIALALGLERSKASRAAIRNALRSLAGQNN